jgi:hypothetical protein
VGAGAAVGDSGERCVLSITAISIFFGSRYAGRWPSGYYATGRLGMRPPCRFSRGFETFAEWLDRNNCEFEQFEAKTGDGGGYIIKAQFAEDDLAELFRR